MPEPMTPDPLNAKLIRQRLDGELPPEQLREFETQLAANPQARIQVEAFEQFERQLKIKVAAVIDAASPGAPAALQSAIRQDLRQAEAAEANATNPVLARIFAGPRRANVFAVAATLMLITGAVLYGIFGTTIDEQRNPAADLVAAASVFVSEQHEQLPAFENQQLSYEQARQNAERSLSTQLQTAVPVFCLKPAGYEFLWGGLSEAMPLPSRAVHLVYEKAGIAGKRVPKASIFIVPRNEACKSLGCGKKWEAEQSAKCKRRVLHSTDGQFVYFVVCCKTDDLDAIVESIDHALASAR